MEEGGRGSAKGVAGEGADEGGRGDRDVRESVGGEGEEGGRSVRKWTVDDVAEWLGECRVSGLGFRI